jgi:VCBS repeat-containing protein
VEGDLVFEPQADTLFNGASDGATQMAAVLSAAEALDDALPIPLDAAQVVIPKGQTVIRMTVSPGEIVALPFGPETQFLAQMKDGHLAIKVGDVVIILEGYDLAQPPVIETADGRPLDIAAILAATDPAVDLETAAGPGGSGGQGADNTGAIFQQLGGGEGGLGGFQGVGAQADSQGPNGQPGAEGSSTTLFRDFNTETNAPPVAKDIGVATDEDHLVSGKLDATDPDGDPLTYAAVGVLPMGVTLDQDGSWSFDPTGHYDQLDTGDATSISFQYKANDGKADSNTATVTIDISGVNDAPTVPFGTTAIFFQEDDTGEGRALVFGIVDPDDTAHTIALTSKLPNGFTYDPVTHAVHGDPAGLYEYLKEGETATFTMKFDVSDGEATVTKDIALTIVGKNDAPVVGDRLVPITENTSIIGFPLAGSDPENQALTYLVVGALPAGVTLNGDGTFSFDPAGNFEGLNDGETKTVSFQYKANDGTDDSNVSTVNILVHGVNDAPVAQDATVTSSEDAPAALFSLPMAADPDNLLLVYHAVGPLPAGVTLHPNGTFSFDPSSQFEHLGDGESTVVSFRYGVSDGTAESNVATVSIVVNGANDAPTVADRVVVTFENLTLNGFPLGGFDPENQALTYQAVGALPPGVTLNGDGTFSFDPAGNFETMNDGQSQVVSFQYKANDGTANSNVATVFITVNGVNDAPVAGDTTGTSNEDAPPTIFALPVVDLDNLALTYQAVGPVPAGVTLNANGTFTFAPGGSYDYLADGESAVVSFQYKANDGVAESNVATVSITVTGANDAPVVSDRVVLTFENLTLNGFPLGGSDPENQALTYQAVGALPPGVTLNGDGTFSFDPAGNFDDLGEGDSKIVTFQYKANDGTADSNVATVFITVNGVNDAPVAGSATLFDGSFNKLTEEYIGTSNVLSLVSDKDTPANLLTYSAVGALPAGISLDPNGTILLNLAGKYDYLKAGEETILTFQYQVSDGQALSNVATISVPVVGVYDAPVGIPDLIRTNNGATTFTLPDWALLANDKSPEGAGLSIGAEQWNLFELTLDHSGGQVTFTDIGALGASFQYAAYDGKTWDWTPASIANQSGGDLGGTPGSEILVGSAAGERIYGGGGKDLIFGGGGDDTLIFQDGDVVQGGGDNAPSKIVDLTLRGDVLAIDHSVDFTKLDLSHFDGIETISAKEIGFGGGVGQTLALGASDVASLSDHTLAPGGLFGEHAAIHIDIEALDQLYLSISKDGGGWIQYGTGPGFLVFAHERTPNDDSTADAYVIVHTPTAANVHLNQDAP